MVTALPRHADDGRSSVTAVDWRQLPVVIVGQESHGVGSSHYYGLGAPAPDAESAGEAPPAYKNENGRPPSPAPREGVETPPGGSPADKPGGRPKKTAKTGERAREKTAPRGESEKAEEGAGKKAAKAIGMGLAGIVGAPLVLAGVGVVAACAVLWGAGKVVEGIGRGFVAGPEAAAKAAMRTMEDGDLPGDKESEDEA
ncbi:hypothetical protein C8Q78DRAFT_1080450 [Trametes maxima]|nr:hypothetical protein C8Q78DRAFT_1080450 [Trametes maxima]